MNQDNTIISTAISRYLSSSGQKTFCLKAALIDMDGTLLDSMPGHTLAWHRMISELGIPCTRDEFYLYEGMTGGETINMLFKRAFGREATMQERKEHYARKTGYFNEMPRVPIVAGADRVVSELIAAGIKRVLVTGSGQLSSLDRLDTDFPGGFRHDMRITSHDVTHCKPHPEPFIKAMELAEVKPNEAMVIENAPMGVEAGVASGAFTVAVTTGPIPPEKMVEAGAHLVLPSMNALADVLPTIISYSNY